MSSSHCRCSCLADGPSSLQIINFLKNLISYFIGVRYVATPHSCSELTLGHRINGWVLGLGIEKMFYVLAGISAAVALTTIVMCAFFSLARGLGWALIGLFARSLWKDLSLLGAEEPGVVLDLVARVLLVKGERKCSKRGMRSIWQYERCAALGHLRAPRAHFALPLSPLARKDALALPTSRTVIIVGITGQQGSSVANALLASSSPYRLVGLSLDIAKPASKKWEKQGVEMRQVSLSLGKEKNVARAFEGGEILFVSAVRGGWGLADGSDRRLRTPLGTGTSSARSTKGSSVRPPLPSYLPLTEPR